MKTAQTNKGVAEGKIQQYKQIIESNRNQLKVLEEQDEKNKPYYRAIEYAKAIYDRAAHDVDAMERPTLSELNILLPRILKKTVQQQRKIRPIGKRL